MREVKEKGGREIVKRTMNLVSFAPPQPISAHPYERHPPTYPTHPPHPIQPSLLCLPCSPSLVTQLSGGRPLSHPPPREPSTPPNPSHCVFETHLPLCSGLCDPPKFSALAHPIRPLFRHRPISIYFNLLFLSLSAVPSEPALFTLLRFSFLFPHLFSPWLGPLMCKLKAKSPHRTLITLFVVLFVCGCFAFFLMNEVSMIYLS